MKKTCVLIPTYNESLAISGLVKTLIAQNLEVLVIDDGSTDATAELARQAGATVLINPRNAGKGACLVKGFNQCLAQGYDSVITMDGDGQHLPEEARLFMHEADRNQECGIVLGNRMDSKGAMPFVRIITNSVMSWIISRICRQRIPDTQCGFRLIRRGVLEKIELKTAKYETESEMLINAARLGFRITSIPITSVYRNERSHINPFVDTIRFIAFILRNRG